MKFSEIIYDFDGTISDTYPVFTKVFVELLAKHGIDETYENAFKKLKVSVPYAFGQYDFGDASVKEVRKEFKAMHLAVALAEQKPIDGAAEILRYTVEHGGRNYLFTHSGKIASDLLSEWGLLEYYTDIIDGSFDINRKPAPDGVLLLLERNGIERKNAIIVGDRDIDIESGKAAGIEGCLFDADRCYLSYECKYNIGGLAELEKVIG